MDQPFAFAMFLVACLAVFLALWLGSFGGDDGKVAVDRKADERSN